MGDLIPLIGDGLLTIDGVWPTRPRAGCSCPPSTTSRWPPASTRDGRGYSTVGSTAWGDGADARRHLRLEPPLWRCGSPCGRCSGSTPARAAGGHDPAERVGGRRSATTGATCSCSCCAGRAARSARWCTARAWLDGVIFGGDRRAGGDPASAATDILGSLLAATDEEGSRLDERRSATRRSRCSSPATTRPPRRSPSSSTSSPATRERLAEQDARAGARRAALRRPLLDVDETLRLYPPAWVGPRRSVDFELPAAGSRPASPSITPPGPATACPRSSPTRERSAPSALLRRRGRSCRRAPTSRSGPGRGSASGCASASSR